MILNSYSYKLMYKAVQHLCAGSFIDLTVQWI